MQTCVINSLCYHRHPRLDANWYAEVYVNQETRDMCVRVFVHRDLHKRPLLVWFSSIKQVRTFPTSPDAVSTNIHKWLSYCKCRMPWLCLFAQQRDPIDHLGISRDNL